MKRFLKIMCALLAFLTVLDVAMPQKASAVDVGAMTALQELFDSTAIDLVINGEILDADLGLHKEVGLNPNTRQVAEKVMIDVAYFAAFMDWDFVCEPGYWEVTMPNGRTVYSTTGTTTLFVLEEEESVEWLTETELRSYINFDQYFTDGNGIYVTLRELLELAGYSVEWLRFNENYAQVRAVSIMHDNSSSNSSAGSPANDSWRGGYQGRFAGSAAS